MGGLLEPFHDTAAPSLDFGLQQRLRRLNPRLRITFSPWAINPQTGQPIIDEVTGAPVHYPAQILWLKTDMGWRHVDEFPMHSGGFGHLNCHYLELNQRTVEAHKPEHLYELLAEKKKVRQELDKRRHHEWREDRNKANAKRIGDLVFNGKSGRRQVKPMSYPGQTNRSTPGEILRDAREDGWEL